ncbi:MAG TPA: NfeD family protein [Candidatus Hodarchaeales archaeon]|nr:NfeD family protein [Candidatus Hodarchaeales archaeon]
MSRKQSSASQSDIGIAAVILLLGIIVGDFIDNYPLATVYTAICIATVLYILSNFGPAGSPSKIVAIVFLLLPIYALLDAQLSLSPTDVFFVVIGVGIGFIIILGSMGSTGFDESTVVIGSVFVVLNAVAYGVDSTGRLNLIIIWIFFAFVVALGYYLTRGISPVPQGSTYVGKIGVVVEQLDPRGKVRIDDEIWNAIAISDQIAKGMFVEVIDKDDKLTLIVREISTPSS